MQYLLIICHDDRFRPSDKLIKDIGTWIVNAEKKKVRVYGNPLRPPSDAMTVRVRQGKLQVIKGPFSRSKEKMCAYELIECATQQEAIEMAYRHPMAKAATIEVRPVWGELARR